MAVYDISKSQLNALQSRLDEAKAFLESRRALWQRLSPEKRKQWREKCPDPMLAKLIAIYEYLQKFFGEGDG